MKRLFIFATLAFVMSCSSCQKGGGGSQQPEEEEKGFVVKGWNGEFVSQMSKAYESFLETNKMPNMINVEGLDYARGKMVAASCQILKKMVAEPETWQDEEADFFDSASCPDNEKNNTVNFDELDMATFLVVVDKIYAYAEEHHGLFPNYCTIDADYTDADGSKYSTKLVSSAITVSFARIFNYYVTNNALPEKFSVWYSDYLHSTANCPVDDPVVVAKMKEIIAGKTTDYEKAEAIFYYSLDEWEWVNYSNTSRGAVKTINQKGGNCCDLSHAVVAIARAAGLPARYRHAQCKYKASGSIIGHVMAEIFVDGKWYLCDPSSSGTTFGNHEAWSVMDTFNGLYNELPF